MENYFKKHRWLPKYETPEQLRDEMEKYFDEKATNKEKATITGLALFLGFESRQSFYDYGKNERFSYVIKKAKMAIENAYETNGSAFDIFALKNMGWTDRVTLEGGENPIKVQTVEPINWVQDMGEVDDLDDLDNE